MIAPAALAAALAASQPASASGVMTVAAVVAPACTIRTAAQGVVVVCAGRTPYVVTRPGRPRGGPEGLTITF